MLIHLEHVDIFRILSFCAVFSNPPVTRIRCSTREGRPGCGTAGPAPARWQGRGSVPPPLPSDKSPSSGSAASWSADPLRMSDCRLPSLPSPNCKGTPRGKWWGEETQGKSYISSVSIAGTQRKETFQETQPGSKLNSRDIILTSRCANSTTGRGESMYFWFWCEMSL